MLQFHPNNPFRSTGWRWELARTMREQKMRRVAKIYDEYVAAAFKFQADMAKCQDDVDRWGVMETRPDLYSAYLIYQRGDDNDRHPLRYALEARLLSGQDFSDIARMMGISPGTVTAYERTFFNVVDRLMQSDYIMTCVLGPSINAGLSDRDYDLLWKLFGYIYGPKVLDAFIKTTSREFRPDTITEVDAALADDARSSLQRKVAVVARTFVVNPLSQSELLNVYARFIEVEKETNSGKAQDVILQNIQVMLDKLPWQTGNDVALDSKIAQYDKQPLELRTDELVSAALGSDLTIETPKFPEQSNDK